MSLPMGLILEHRKEEKVSRTRIARMADPVEIGHGGDATEASSSQIGEIGIFDSHCHPTDTVSSLSLIPSMKAQVLTVMATRQEDQQLVLSASEKYGLDLEGYKTLLAGQRLLSTRIIPSFGWHPWFSHHLYDDLVNPPTYVREKKGDPDFKALHYGAVLTKPKVKREMIDSLPEPRSLAEYIEETRQNLKSHPLALVGEVGLDKTFRPPEVWTEEQKAARDQTLTPGGREGRPLSKHHVQMYHERAVLLAQLRLAGELKRPVSVHGVAAHGVLYDTFAESWKGYERTSKSELRRQMAAAMDGMYDSDDDQSNAVESQTPEILEVRPGPYPPRICLHSYSGPAEHLKQWYHPTNPAEVWVSFSSVINFPDGPGKATDSVKTVPEDKLLIESDLHTAGPEMDKRLDEIVDIVCDIRGWKRKQALQILARNWKAFVFGS